MKRLIFAVMMLGMAGCAVKKNNVQEGGFSIKEALEHNFEAHCAPWIDVSFVDQCFELNCRTKKFSLWNPNCPEKEFAKKLIKENPEYFEERQ